jgi:hypothetical protein
MQFILTMTICSVMLSDYLVKLLSLPTMLHFLPELLSGVILLYVVFVGTRDRFSRVSPKYWFAFGALGVIALCGIINNGSGSGPMLSGMRFYLRAVPLFFLPAVLTITEEQLKRQLFLILGLAYLQLPIAVYQRYVVLSQGRFTGDEVQGTLMDSGILSIFLICVTLVLLGLMLKKRIGKLQALVLSLVVLFPSVINETKGTLVMLPVAMIVCLVLGAEQGKRLRYAVGTLAGFAMFVALFIPIYNMMEVHNPYKNDKDITNFFTNEKQLDRYMSSNVGGVGTTKDVRRGDALMVPLQFLARDPSQLAFGLGMGAVSPSNFGKNFEGSYFLLFKKFLITSFTFFLLEFGLFGLAVIGVLFWMIFSDTLVVSRTDDSLIGAVAAGWTGVIALIGLGIEYTIFHEFTSVTFLSWYFSGIICARRMALARRPVAAREAAAHAQFDPVT